MDAAAGEGASLVDRATIDKALATAGDMLSWSQLRDVVVAQHLGDTIGVAAQDLGRRVLASIPAEYLSCEDEFVRLSPVATSSASWCGWLPALQEALLSAGGAMPWMHLRDAMVARYCSTGAEGDHGDRDALGVRALAAVPLEYVSQDDELVRLPAEAGASGKKRKSCTSSDAASIDSAVTVPTKRRRADEEGRLKLVGDRAPEGIKWTYPLCDDEWRCYVGHLPGALESSVAARFFDIVDNGVPWERSGPRWTAWLVAPPCTCAYGYGGFKVQPKTFPSWMWEIMAAVMPLCGFSDRASWPNSCNLNRYDDGWGSVGWHSDDEYLFQGKYTDCLIISLSLGQARTFSVRLGRGGGWEENLLLEGGDLCTMEGMTQKYYQHAALKAESGGSNMGPRLNLTWRWVVIHEDSCSAARCS
eukprot:gnl/TRDRNA2_/TRDRNA2_134806_c0_seq1.p1 gnl/TRDRNA2_/TRDRNA2_134806_c0~~gnl/TRDRNA2_/TRDRNA2_134806_c0_seq1.p1  ORF type:complete len:430 (+),score=68.08 gnl/TRDRNA2_/TRDRNA2_134806_c0_seq1:41-1291(+)